MSIEKANQWLKQNYPQLDGYEITSIANELCFAIEEFDDGAILRLAPSGFVYAFANVDPDVYGPECDGSIVLLMPEDL